MKSTMKLISRFFFILVLSVTAGIVLNIAFVITAVYTQSHTNQGDAWSNAQLVAEGLAQTEKGYSLGQEAQETLEKAGAWAILIENGSGQVIWASENLPDDIPRQYSLGALSWGIRGYIQDYPTTVSPMGDNLVVLGYPKTSYFKLMWNTFDYHLIQSVPYLLLEFVLFNIVLLVIIYIVSSAGVIRSVKPIVKGIEALGQQQDVYVKESGLLCQLAVSINRVAERLKTQNYALRKKETARANWIAGVSHDIRTPLSMVLGYAGTLEEDKELPPEARKQAGVIRLQAVRMKNLINDLNLASKLEYNVQPLHRKSLNLVALSRQSAVDFLNLDHKGQYPIEWETEPEQGPLYIDGDEALIKRALSNLISNAQVHNPEGCTIFLKAESREGWGLLTLADNGAGVTDKELESIKNAPHYMVCDTGTGEQRHGLGLLIVRQIVQAHQGRTEVFRPEGGGFGVRLWFPLQEK